MEWAAVDTVPRELITEAKATYPKEVAKRFRAEGMATRMQGFSMAGSGRRDLPRGETWGCRHSAAVISTPPTATAMAVPQAAPTTPRPAPGMRRESPSSATSRGS